MTITHSLANSLNYVFRSHTSSSAYAFGYENKSFMNGSERKPNLAKYDLE